MKDENSYYQTFYYHTLLFLNDMVGSFTAEPCIGWTKVELFNCLRDLVERNLMTPLEKGIG